MMEDSLPTDDPLRVALARRQVAHDQRWGWPLLVVAILAGFALVIAP